MNKVEFCPKSCFISLPRYFTCEVFIDVISIYNSELHKNVACHFKQTLKAASYKTAVIWSLTSRFTNPQSKTSKICWPLLAKYG